MRSKGRSDRFTWARTSLLAIGIGAAAVAWACMGEMSNSVHFTDSDVDFGSPPDEVVVPSWGESAARPVRIWPFDMYTGAADRNWESGYFNRATLLAEDLKSADEFAAREQWKDAMDATSRALTRNPDDAAVLRSRLERFRQRNEIAELLRQGKAPGKLDVLYRAWRLTDQGQDEAASTLLENLFTYEYDKPVKPYENVAQLYAGYEMASQSYRRFPDSGGDEYLRAAALGGPRRESALMMAARGYLRQPDESTSSKPTKEHLDKGRAALRDLNREFPNSRFRWSALGWLGRVALLEGRRADAVVCYLRQILTTPNLDDKINAYSSIRLVGAKMTPADARALRTRLLASPDLLEPYCAFRLHHSGQPWDDSDRRDLPGLAELVRIALEANPKTKLSPGLEARLGEIALLNANPAGAKKLAQASLSQASLPLAEYVLASALHRLGEPKEARSVLERLVATYPQSYLLSPARELLAICQEATGDLTAALDTYRDLKYDLDIAYLVDVRMSVDEVAAYAQKHPEPLWRYSLGLRYLRQNRLGEAEKQFESIADDERRKLAMVGSRDYSWSDEPHDSLYDPLVTTRDLLRLQAEVGASTGEKRAAAQYAQASYPYDRRHLLFYNPSLWKGSRQLLASPNNVTTNRAGRLAIAEHSYEHETLWKARKLCLEVAKEHPKSEWSAKALYRAACASRRLADLNNWWRTQNKQQDLHEDGARLMARVYKEHPGSPLAKMARKYEGVFRQEGRGEAVAQLFSNGQGVGASQ